MNRLSEVNQQLEDGTKTSETAPAVKLGATPAASSPNYLMEVNDGIKAEENDLSVVEKVTDFGRNLGRGIHKGAVSRLPQMAGQAAQWLDPDGGIDVVENIGKKIEGFGASRENDIKPTAYAQNNPDSWSHAAFEGGESLVPSIAPTAAAVAAAPFVGTAGAVVAGAGALGALFYGSSAEEAHREADKVEGLSEDQKMEYANIVGGIEAGGEYAQQAIGLALPFIKFLPKAARGKVLSSITGKLGIKGGVKELAKIVTGEVAVEMGQQMGQSQAAKGYGVRPDAQPWQEAKQVLKPTVVMTSVMGLFGLSGGAVNRNRLRNALENPEVDKEKRIKAVERIAGEAAKTDKNLATAFYKEAMGAINSGQPVVIPETDPTVAPPADDGTAPPAPKSQEPPVDAGAAPPPIPPAPPAPLDLKPRGPLTRAAEAALFAPPAPQETGFGAQKAETPLTETIPDSGPGISDQEAAAFGAQAAYDKYQPGIPEPSPEAVRRKNLEGLKARTNRPSTPAEIKATLRDMPENEVEAYLKKQEEIKQAFESKDYEKQQEAAKLKKEQEVKDFQAVEDKEKELDKQLAGSFYPPEVEKAAKKEAEEIIRANPFYSIMAEAKKRGGINKEQMLKDFDAATVSSLNRKYPGLISSGSEVSPDGFAQEQGFREADEMIEALKSVPTMKAERLRLLEEKNQEWQATEEAAQRESANAEDVAEKANEAATSPENNLPEPTEAQKEAGNYKLGHTKIAGLDISIENPAGSERKGVDPDGKAWSIGLKSHYGYIKGTVGKDKDHLDVFINPDTPDSGKVYVVDQVNKDGSFDEHKIVLGRESEEAARKAYLDNYEKGWTGLGAITEMSTDEFKEWTKGNTTKPVALKEKKEKALEAKGIEEKATEEQAEERTAGEPGQEVKIKGPVANKHGVYSEKYAEVVEYKRKKASAKVKLLEIPGKGWIASPSSNHLQGSYTGFSGPLSTSDTAYKSREEALVPALQRIISHNREIEERNDSATNDKQRKEAAKIIAWAEGLLKEAGQTPEVEEQQTEDKQVTRAKAKIEEITTELDKKDKTLKGRGYKLDASFGKTSAHRYPSSFNELQGNITILEAYLEKREGYQQRLANPPSKHTYNQPEYLKDAIAKLDKRIEDVLNNDLQADKYQLIPEPEDGVKSPDGKLTNVVKAKVKFESPERKKDALEIFGSTDFDAVVGLKRTSSGSPDYFQAEAVSNEYGDSLKGFSAIGKTRQEAINNLGKDMLNHVEYKKFNKRKDFTAEELDGFQNWKIRAIASSKSLERWKTRRMGTLKREILASQGQLDMFPATTRPLPKESKGVFTASPMEKLVANAPQWRKDQQIDDVLRDNSGAPPKQGKSFKAILFQGKGRDKQSKIYNNDALGPIFGKAEYYAITEEDAKPFGPDITSQEISLKSPVVINGDKDIEVWAPAGEKIPADNKARNEYFAKVRKSIEAAGHDGIIIIVPYTTDIGFTGERVKQLRALFGTTQVVVFSKEKKEPWQMTRDQHWEQNKYKKGKLQSREKTHNAYYVMLGQAYKSGKKIPTDILLGAPGVIRSDLSDNQQDEMIDDTFKLPPEERLAAWESWGREEKSLQKGKVGGMLRPGEVELTATGRKTTPFPSNIDTSTNRKASNTLKRIDRWLIKNAIAEAKARKDDFNLLQFENINLKNISQADKDSAEQYLFGDEQPPVLTSMTKPLVEKAEEVKGTAKPEKPIEDFGEKIGGARKDYFTTLTKAKEMDTASHPLSKTFPKPDYQKLLDSGVDPYIVGFVRASREEIPTKPRSRYRLGGWVQQVELLRGVADKMLNGRIPKDKILEKMPDTLGDTIGFRAEMYADLGHSKPLQGIRITKGSYSVFNSVKYDPPKIIWSVEKKAKSTAFSNFPSVIASGATRKEAIEDFKKKYAAMPDSNKTGRKVKFGLYRLRKDKDGVWIGKKVGRNYIDLKRFDDIKSAKEYRENNYDDLVAMLEKKKYVPDLRRKSNEERIGVDHRNGEDVTPEKFTETFGFRGVEFGNWVKKTNERQNALNNAYDALSDLATILDIPMKAMSLNGELGLAFGARGRGGKGAATAHYEPGRVVINLTRREGAGSLAHEWWHALDNYFSRMRKYPDQHLTERPYQLGPDNQLRDEMITAFRNLVDAYRSTGIPKRSRKLDSKRSKAYWSTDAEISARAFEGYVIGKLEAEGNLNDYLANIVGKDFFVEDMIAHIGDPDFQAMDYYPYATEEEYGVIEKAFDSFFKTVEHKKTDKGVALSEPGAQYTTIEEGGVRYEVPGETDTATDHRTGEGTGVRNQPKQTALFPEKGRPGSARKKEKFLESYPARIGTFSFDRRIIADYKDAAHVLSPLSKRAQETFMALVLDRNKKPIAVVQHSVGGPKSNQVFPVQLVGSIHNLKGAASVWVAHNHPSGAVGKSPEDVDLTKNLNNFFKDTGVQLNGHIIMAPGEQASVFFSDEQRESVFFDIPTPIRKTEKVKVTERRLKGDRPELITDETITNSVDAAQKMSDYSRGMNGVLLLDTQHRPIRFISLTMDEMRNLRKGGKEGAASKLYRVFDRKNNAVSVILNLNKDNTDTRKAVENMVSFFQGLGVDVLDALVAGNSRADSGEIGRAKVDARTAENVFYSKQKGASIPAGRKAADVQAEADTITKNWKKSAIIVVHNVFTLPKGLRNHVIREGSVDSVQGLYDPKSGNVYLIAGNITKGDSVKTLILHEVVGHFGVEEVVKRGGWLWSDISEMISSSNRRSIREARQAVLETHGVLDDRTQAKEVVAYLAQNNPEHSLVKRVIAAIMKGLRALGFDMKVTESELFDLIRQGEDFATFDGASLQKGAQTSPYLQKKTPVWYSPAARAAANLKQAKGSPAQMLAMLKKAPGVKAEELEWLGLEEWLDNYREFLIEQEVAKRSRENFNPLALVTGEIQAEVEKTIPKNPKVTRDEIANFINQNGVQVEEVVKGTEFTQDDIDVRAEEIHTAEVNNRVEELEDEGLEVNEDTRIDISNEIEWPYDEAARQLQQENAEEVKFADYQLPGGENYKELLLTLPRKQTSLNEDAQRVFGKDFMDLNDEQVKMMKSELQDPSNTHTGGHYDEPNVLAHIRFNERTDADGNRVLFIEEIQSDWHQEGRKKGYKDYPGRTVGWVAKKVNDDLFEVTLPDGSRYHSGEAKTPEEAIEIVSRNRQKQNRVPNAPFKKTWPLLAMKRMIRYAAENGFDKVAWTTGEQQADRYDLSKQVEEVAYTKSTQHLRVVTHDGVVAINEKTTEDKLEGVIGKEITEKIVNSEKRFVRLTGLDLKVGGKGMKAFYDEMLPSAVNKFAKKFGGKVEEVRINTEKDEYRSYSDEDEARGIQLQEELYELRTRQDSSSENLAEQRKRIDELHALRGKYDTSLVHSLTLTPDMKQAAMAGMPLFSRAAAATPETPDFDTDLKESATFIKEKAGKKYDSSFMQRVFSTPEHYFDKDEAGGRVLKAALNRRDLKHKMETQIRGEEFTPYVKELKKKNKKAYTEANDYLLETDKTGNGFSFAQNDDVFEVRNPKGDVIGSEQEEREAQQLMVELEAQWLAEEGYSEEAIRAVVLARELTNRGFDELAEDMRRMIAEAKEAGLPTPLAGEGMIDEAGRYGVYAEGRTRPVALFATEAEAIAKLQEAAKFISYAVVGSSKNPKDFDNQLRADAHARQHGGKVQETKRFKNLSVRRRDDAELRPMTMQEALAQMGDLRGTFFPRLREPGAYILFAEKAGEAPIRLHFDLPFAARNAKSWALTKIAKRLTNSVTPIGRKYKQLTKDGYTVRIEKDEKPSEDVFDATKLISSIDSILQQSMSVIDPNKPDDLAAGQHINQLITLRAADIFKARGYLSSRMKRQEGDIVWEGYEEDLLKALTQYSKNIGAGIAKRETAKEMVMAFTGRDYSWTEYKRDVVDPQWLDYQEIIEERRIHPGKQRNLYEDVRGFMGDVLRNDEQVDRIMGTLRGLAVLKFLAFRVSSAAVNMTNMAQAVPAVMNAQTGVSLTRSARLIANAATSYAKYRSGKGSLSAEDRAIFQEIVDRGWDEAQFDHEAAGTLRSRGGEIWAKIMDTGMFAFAAVEKANRATTIFAGYKAATRGKKLSKIDEGALQKAKVISDKAHGVYGKETLPRWARGKNNPLKLAYTFQKFSHNYMLNMVEMGMTPGQRKAAAYMLLSPALLAGTGATLATPAIAMMASALGIGGDDPEEEFYAWAEDTFGTDRLFRHGLAGATLGVNLKGSLQMHNPIPTRMGELLGAPQAVWKDTLRSAKHFRKGEVWKGTEAMLPLGFGNMAKALREYSEGLTTSSYAPVFYGTEPVKGTMADATARFFSFNPTRISTIREKQWSEKKIKRRYAEKQRDIYDKIRRLFLTGELQHGLPPHILKEITRYNEMVKGSGRRDINRIYPQSIMRVLRRANRPSKVERLRRAQ